MKIEIFYFVREDGSVNVSLHSNLRDAVEQFLNEVRGYGDNLNIDAAQICVDAGEYEMALEYLNAIEGDFFDMDTLKVDSEWIEIN